MLEDYNKLVIKQAQDIVKLKSAQKSFIKDLSDGTLDDKEIAKQFLFTNTAALSSDRTPDQELANDKRDFRIKHNNAI
jgi:hypothetical protein